MLLQEQLIVFGQGYEEILSFCIPTAFSTAVVSLANFEDLERNQIRCGVGSEEAV
jgi:hypothetical protein